MPVYMNIKPFKRQPWKPSVFSIKGVRRPLKLLKIEFPYPPTNVFKRIQPQVQRNCIEQEIIEEHLLDSTFTIIISSFYVDLVIIFGNCLLIITSNDS